jgi:cytochrome c-type biogenesis protein CcmH
LPTLPEAIKVVVKPTPVERFGKSLYASKRAAYGFVLLLVLLFPTVFANSVAAQSGQPITDDEVNEIAHELFCPVCENTPLDVCPTQACADWREIIRTKLSEGETEQQIKDYFAEQYGPRALAEPPQEGFTLAVWIVPILAVVVGGFFFARYIRGIQVTSPVSVDDGQSRGQQIPDNEPAQDDYTARIERELREREK